jgi:hypothetical protein
MYAIQTAKFSCLRGITTGTLLGGQRTFPAVFRFPIEEFSSNFKPRTFHVCAIKGIGLVAIDGKLRVLYLENIEPFRL